MNVAVHFNVHGSSFMGLKMAQYWADLALWEYFLAEHTEIGTIVELGTGAGGMSAFFLGSSIERGFDFWTFDKIPYRFSPLLRALGMKDHFTAGDIFGGIHLEVVNYIKEAENRPLLLFCDNGNKTREVEVFTSHLQPGDYLVVHDYGVEFKAEDIEPVAHLVESYYEEECRSHIPCITRFWRRIEDE